MTRINTNMAALNAWRSLNSNTGNLQKSLEKLSSGFRINRAADDAAGLAVSEKMRAQIRGTNQALRNAQDGIGMVQTAEGGAGQIQGMLQRMRELTVQAANGALTDPDRTQLDTEFQALKDEVDKTASSLSYNGIKLLDGTVSAVKIQVGANDAETRDLTIGNMSTAAAGLNIAGLAIDTMANIGTGATGVLQKLDGAISQVSTARAGLGTMQNRLDNVVGTLTVQSENLTNSESRIRDVDMAAEMASFTKYQVLTQASTAMLAQANQTSQGILSLLRG